MDARVKKAISLIQDDLSKDRQLDEVARTVNLSSSRLNHLFKTEIGLTIAKYVRSLRMERAKGLLETTFLTVKEIGNECGLNDESHFVQNFKAAYGRTPLRYRQDHHRKRDES
ncbi:MAG: helix-turn-helix domain-containing protein [Pyrinomonadaceae bacterium]